MHILVTNDDGVQAPGLLALAQAMRQVATVRQSPGFTRESPSSPVLAMTRAEASMAPAET